MNHWEAVIGAADTCNRGFGGPPRWDGSGARRPQPDRRLVFRQHRKERLVKDANVMAILGLAALAWRSRRPCCSWSAMCPRERRSWSSRSASSAFSPGLVLPATHPPPEQVPVV